MATHPTPTALTPSPLTNVTPRVTENCMSEAREPRREGSDTSTM